MKKIFPILAVVLALACAAGGFFLGRQTGRSKAFENESGSVATAKQEDFLAAMAAGLKNRQSTADETDTSEMSKEELSAHFKDLIKLETDKIGKYEGAEFEDKTFNALVKTYFQALNMQLKATDNYKHESLFNGLWQGGYTVRCGVISELYENYDLGLTSEEAESFIQEVTPEMYYSYELVNSSDSEEIEEVDEKEAKAPLKPYVIPAKDLEYVEYGGEIQINKYTGGGGNVIIPSSIDGVKVTRIGKEAFRGCESLTGLSIPGSIKYIGEYAFNRAMTDDCGGILILPSSIEKIEFQAFSYNDFAGVVVKCSCEISFNFMSSLEYVIVDKSATPILDDAFRYTSSDNLKTIIIPDNGTTLKGNKVFEDAQNATVYTPANSPAARYAASNFVAVNSKDFEKMYKEYISD